MSATPEPHRRTAPARDWRAACRELHSRGLSAQDIAELLGAHPLAVRRALALPVPEDRP